MGGMTPLTFDAFVYSSMESGKKGKEFYLFPARIENIRDGIYHSICFIPHSVTHLLYSLKTLSPLPEC